MEAETIPTGHSVALTVACPQARGQRHTQLSMGHGMGEEDTGTKSGTPGSREWKVAGSAEGGEHVTGTQLALPALGSG